MKLPVRIDKGFTLVELLITLAVVGVMLTVAVPSFRIMIRDHRIATQINNFVNALYLARSEAIKRKTRVTLCKSNVSAVNPTCTTNGDYRQGWIVFMDPNNNATIDAGEAVLRGYNELSDDAMTFTGNTPVANYVSFMLDGKTKTVTGAFQAGTITLCKDSKARKIVISSTGRVRVIKEATC